MDSDPSRIPVEPIPFEYGLTRFAQSIRGRTKIVAIGSSSTVGHGGIRPYPERLLSFLQAQYPNAKITMINQGIGGQEAPLEFQRFDSDVIAEKPDLVIWQNEFGLAKPGPECSLARRNHQRHPRRAAQTAHGNRGRRHSDGPPIRAGRAHPAKEG